MWNLFKRVTPASGHFIMCVCLCVCHHHNHHHLWLRKHSFTYSFRSSAAQLTDEAGPSVSPSAHSSFPHSSTLYFFIFFPHSISVSASLIASFLFHLFLSVPSICLPLLTIRSFPCFIFCLCHFCWLSIHRGRYHHERSVSDKKWWGPTWTHYHQKKNKKNNYFTCDMLCSCERLRL